MNSLPERVMKYAKATPIPADDLALGHLCGGGPAAVPRRLGECAGGSPRRVQQSNEA